MTPKKPKAFLVIIRGSDPKQIDEDELAKVIGCWARKSGTVVRQGFINGVDIADIREDEKRIRAFMEKVDSAVEHNRFDLDYHGGKSQREVPRLAPLRDIFEGVDIMKYMPKDKGDNGHLESGRRLE